MWTATSHTASVLRQGRQQITVPEWQRGQALGGHLAQFLLVALLRPGQGHPVLWGVLHARVASSIPGLCPLDAISSPPPTVTTRHCHMSIGVGAKSPPPP